MDIVPDMVRGPCVTVIELQFGTSVAVAVGGSVAVGLRVTVGESVAVGGSVAVGDNVGGGVLLAVAVPSRI
jgi:UDP-3-O-[3-hydroxymyristoyl] glucosamine N-acyltransferase